MGIIERIVNPRPEGIATVLADLRLPRQRSALQSPISCGPFVQRRMRVVRLRTAVRSCRCATLAVPRSVVNTAKNLLDPSLRTAIERAKGNISRFHAAQRPVDETGGD
jgi:hypothetical protein